MVTLFKRQDGFLGQELYEGLQKFWTVRQMEGNHWEREMDSKAIFSIDLGEGDPQAMPLVI